MNFQGFSISYSPGHVKCCAGAAVASKDAAACRHGRHRSPNSSPPLLCQICHAHFFLGHAHFGESARELAEPVGSLRERREER